MQINACECVCALKIGKKSRIKGFSFRFHLAATCFSFRRIPQHLRIRRDFIIQFEILNKEKSDSDEKLKIWRVCGYPTSHMAFVASLEPKTGPERNIFCKTFKFAFLVWTSTCLFTPEDLRGIWRSIIYVYLMPFKKLSYAGFLFSFRSSDKLWIFKETFNQLLWKKSLKKSC